MNKWNWIEENERGLWINDLFQIWTFYCIHKSFIYLFYIIFFYFILEYKYRITIKLDFLTAWKNMKDFFVL